MLKGACGSQLGGSLGTPEDVFKHGHEVSTVPSISYGTSICCASVSRLLRYSPVPSLSSYLPHLIGFYLVIFAGTKHSTKGTYGRIYPCS